MQTITHYIFSILFQAVCAYMLYSSLAFTGKGALVGAAVLLTGIPVYLVTSKLKWLQ